MAIHQEQIDWNEIEDRASRMTPKQLRDACKSICDSLESADRLDIATGTCRGGYLRDELSVYRRLLKEADTGGIRTVRLNGKQIDYLLGVLSRVDTTTSVAISKALRGGR